MLKRFLLGVPAIAALAVLTTRLVPGLQKDRTTLLPSGWRIRPAGRQVPVGTLPLNLLTLSDGSLLVTSTDPSESVSRLSGSVPTGTCLPAGRIRQPDRRSVVRSFCGPGTRRVVSTARAAIAGTPSRNRLSMGRKYGCSRRCSHPLRLSRHDGGHLPSHPAHPLGSRVVPAARCVPGAIDSSSGRLERATAGGRRLPELPARRSDRAARRLPACAPGAGGRCEGAREDRPPPGRPVVRARRRIDPVGRVPGAEPVAGGG